MRRRSFSVLALPLACSAAFVPACSPVPPRPPSTPEREYPCILHPAAELRPEFSVMQHVEASKDGRSGAFDAVLQKQGNKLVIVGLGPAGVRAFVLEQTGDAITFERSMGPELPFSPRNVLVDVHRAFFKRLASPPPSGSGTVKGTVDDEEVEEDWRDANLVERRFTRPGSTYQGAVRVTYAPGCTRERCAPPTIRLVNEWFSYALKIDCTEFNWL